MVGAERSGTQEDGREADGRASAARQEAQGIGVSFLTIVAQAALPAFHVQLARLLGASDYGLYTWSNSFVDMLSVLTLVGMDTATARRVSIAHAQGDLAAAARATGTALRVVLLTGVFIACVIGLLAPTVGGWQDKQGLVGPLRILAFVPVAYHATSIFLVATQGKMVMRYDFWTRGIVQPLGLLLLTTLALRVGPTLAAQPLGAPVGAGSSLETTVLGAGSSPWPLVDLACLAVVTGMVTTTLVSGYFYSREFPMGITLRALLRGPVDWSLVRMGIPLVLTVLFWSLQGRMDGFALGFYRSSAEVGAYGACMIYVVSLGQVRSAFYPVMAARVPALLAADNREELQAFFRRQCRWVALLALPLAVFFAGFGDGLLAVFGNEFRASASALAILALGHLTVALTLPVSVLTLGPHARYSAAAAVACIGLQGALLPVLVPRWGTVGAATSATAALAISQVVQLVFVRRLYGVQGLTWAVGKVAVAAALGFAVGRFLFQGLPMALVPRFLLGVAAAAVVYTGAVVGLGLEAEEKDLLAESRKKARKLLRFAG